MFNTTYKIQPNPTITQTDGHDVSETDLNVSSTKYTSPNIWNSNGESLSKFKNQDIENSNENSRLRFNSFSSFKDRIKSAVSLSKISSDIDEPEYLTQINQKEGKILEINENNFNSTELLEKLKSVEIIENPENIISDSVPELKVATLVSKKSEICDSDSILRNDHYKEYNSSANNNNILKSFKAASASKLKTENFIDSSSALKDKSLEVSKKESSNSTHQIENPEIIKASYHKLENLENENVSQKHLLKNSFETEENSDNFSLSKFNNFLTFEMTPNPFSQFTNDLNNNIETTETNIHRIEPFQKSPSYNVYLNKQKIINDIESDNSLDAVLPVTVELLNH